MFWTKHGSAWTPKAESKLGPHWTKSGSIVSRYGEDGRVIAEKINGKYWLYALYEPIGGIGRKMLVCQSDDCIAWTPLEDEREGVLDVLPARAGKFDCDLTEPGPPPVVTPRGILLIYTGKSDQKHGDPRVPQNGYSGGQALFDGKNPARLIARCDDFFIAPRMPYELVNAVGCPVTFLESMVRFRGKWFLYYGSSDKVVSVA